MSHRFANRLGMLLLPLLMLAGLLLPVKTSAKAVEPALHFAKTYISAEAEIDIRPGEAGNIINPAKNGVVPLAILSSPILDAPAEINPASVHLAGAPVIRGGHGEPLCRSKDVNSDNLDDLVCHIQANRLNLQTGESVAKWTAQTNDGDIIAGQDKIWLVPQGMGLGGLRALELH